MEPTTIEGTWEEVSRRAEELAGRRVRVIVLDAAPPESSRARQADADAASPATNPVMGMFSDAPDLLDEVVEEAMKIREERPWRLPAGE